MNRVLDITIKDLLQLLRDRKVFMFLLIMPVAGVMVDRYNRKLMMEQMIDAIADSGEVKPFKAELQVVNCHHNYVARETHYGEEVLVTRKGAQWELGPRGHDLLELLTY